LAGGVHWVRRMPNHLTVVRSSDRGAELPLRLSPVDLGRAVCSAALSVWGEVEVRAELLLQIDCVGPVLADERRLVQLLRELARHLLTSLPEAPAERQVLRLRSRCYGPRKARVEVRTLLQGAESFPSLPVLATASPNPRIKLWARSAAAFGATLHVDSGDAPKALLLEIDLSGE
jgi:hypothetical protein